MRLITLAAVLAFSLGAARISAQAPVATGDRVRVWTDAGLLEEESTVAAVLRDTIVVRHLRTAVDAGRVILVDTLPMSSVRRIDVLRGRDLRRIALGAGVGFGTGFLVGS